MIATRAKADPETVCGQLAGEFPGVSFTWTRQLGYQADFGDGSHPAVSLSHTALACYVALTLQRREQ